MIYGTPTIVTNGLVLNLDAANTKSYVSGSTNWFSLGNPSLSGSLVNGPTFSTNNAGGILFDGVDDYVLVNSGSTLINPTTAITVASYFNISSYGANYAPLILKQNNYNSFLEQYALYLVNTEIGFAITGVDRSQKIARSTADYRNQFIQAVGTCDINTDELKLYINGILIQTTSFTSTFDIADTPINIGGTGVLKFGPPFNGFANGKIYTAQIYNRALSQQEITQNYNAYKSRFGLS